MGHPYWPLFDLRARTERLELRLPEERDIFRLIDVALRHGIHDPATMPFGQPWTDRERPEFEWEFLRWYWRGRADLTPDSWNLAFVVVVDGEPAGIQGADAESFPTLRSFATGSWLTRPHQGQGYGKEMRAALLHLMFEGLGAEVANSEAFLDNPTSLAVSRSLGYEENGVGRHAPRGEPRDTLKFRLTAERWRALKAEGRYPHIELEGVEGARYFLGLDEERAQGGGA